MTTRWDCLEPRIWRRPAESAGRKGRYQIPANGILVCNKKQIVELETQVSNTSNVPKHKYSRIALGERSQPRLSYVVGLGLASILVGGCGTSGNDVSTGPSIGAGGNSGATTATQTGGDRTLNTGGSPSSGGTSSLAVSSGGAATGGATTVNNVGGANTGSTAFSTGGALHTGGTPSTLAATGGKSTGGGGSAVAGASATTGGNASTGGVAATGGSKAASGGAVATGGYSSTSSCSPSSTKFSFFITSQARLFALAQAFNGNTKGFGGDLRYGQTTGLAGADKICTAIAETSMPGNCKTWRAFLSAADGGSGTQVNAISRIGNGPWYDRVARLVANSTSELLNTRPTTANTAIINDLPNEDGVPNHDALLTGNTTNQDNHDILTGTSTTGTLYSASSTCSNWTSSTGSSSQKPRCGHSWPAGSGGGGMGGGTMASWMSALDEAGCAPGYNLAESVNGMPSVPGGDGTMTVGSGGGYGGIYCFALNP